MSSTKIIFTTSGPDRPGITSALMEIFQNHKIELVDMGQAVTHGLLSLSIVINKPSSATYDSVLKDLLFVADQKKLKLVYQSLESSEFTPSNHVPKFILNCVAVNDLSAKFLQELTLVLAKAKVNILRIDKVSPDGFKSLEFTTQIPDDLNLDLLKQDLLRISDSFKVDMAFLKDNVFRRNKRLIVFDMDSTLIQTEVIDELAELAGKGKEVREITHRAMNGEIDFDISLKERVSKLEGVKVSDMEKVLTQLPLTEGVEEFIKTLKSVGYKIALISGGFTFFADSLKEKLGIDYSFANELQIKNGLLTGKINGPIVNAAQKALLVRMIAQQENINLEQVVAIGDGANDLPMLSMAGLGIAFHAKERVKKEAGHHMSHGPMTSILYFLGIHGPVNH